MSIPTEDVLELLDAGCGASLQDLGRRGWKRFGVPPGGALDDHAARWANLLVGNPMNLPVLELLLQGAVVRARRSAELAVTGAAVDANSGGRWRTWVLKAGEEIVVPPSRGGVWTYLAVRGGWVGPRWFGSVSIYPRGGLGESLAAGAVLQRPGGGLPAWPPGVGHRWLDPQEQRDYLRPPTIPVWPGPQWDLFPEPSRRTFFEQSWRISSRCDRTGYRLEGEAIPGVAESIPSEPILPGSIQVPPDGVPIVIMKDGPTVGGYPKLGRVDPGALSWLAQCRPGQEVRFCEVPAS